MSPSKKRPTNSTLSPADLLAEIASVYSHLAPLFAAVRSDPHFAGHTLLPAALSPLAPAMAWSHTRNLRDEEVLKKLGEHPTWKSAEVRLASLYKAYQELSGNALLWAGWNYWNPAAPDEPLDGRVIQVVLTAELAAKSDLFSPDRRLVGAGQNALWGRDFLRKPQGWPQGDVPLAAGVSGDDNVLAEELSRASLFLFNLWGSLFIPSAAAFQTAGMPTIVDHVKAEFLSYSANPDANVPITDIEVIFQAADGARERIHSESHEDVRSFVCRPDWTQLLWKAVDEELENQKIEPTDGTDPSRRLRKAWERLARQPPAGMQEAGAALSQALHIDLSAGRAYALLQHLALFERFLDSRYQYILPITFGRHLFVAFLTMRMPLGRSELLGWRQVVTTLFGGLIVERVSELLRRQQLDEWESELRRVLSHAMPKAVFQPAQYFAGKILMAMERSADAGIAQRDAHALLFLLEKGQADLAGLTFQGGHARAADDGTRPVSEPHGRDQTDSPLDLFEACDHLKDHFDAIKEFLLAGQVDRAHRESIAANLGCEVVPKVGRPKVLVRMNRSILFLHLWNLIDNAFRHGGLVALAKTRSCKIQLSIALDQPGGFAKLQVQNAGRPIDADRAGRLNQILNAAPDALSAEISRGFARPSDSFPESEMEDDHEGSGIARFSLYLGSLWKSAGDPNRGRGSVTALGEGTSLEFYIPWEATTW